MGSFPEASGDPFQITLSYVSLEITCKGQKKYPTNMPLKHYIKVINNKNMLGKGVTLTSFQNPQLQSVLIFFKFDNP